MRLEQPTIEKGDGTKCRRGAAAFVGRAVQRAEEQWPQQISLYPAAPPEAAIHLLCHEAVSPAEPAFRLYEIEKQDAGELKKRQTMPIQIRYVARQAATQTLEGGTELTKEAAADSLGAERIGRSRREG
jgi:hypothetical protein